jgi:hypothetical protein
MLYHEYQILGHHWDEFHKMVQHGAWSDLLINLCVSWYAIDHEYALYSKLKDNLQKSWTGSIATVAISFAFLFLWLNHLDQIIAQPQYVDFSPTQAIVWAVGDIPLHLNSLNLLS